MTVIYAVTKHDGVKHDVQITEKVPVNRSRTGYGSKIATQYKTRIGNRFYRIYAMCYSNVAVMYVLVKGVRYNVEIYK